ncbi:MAG: AtpZ/AtpI family protein [Oricola sp.]
MSDKKRESNHLSDAARDAIERDEMLAKDPEPSLAQRFGQIGILGWMIVAPVLGAIFIGHKADRFFHTGITFTTALTMAGAVLGLWLAFRWMHEQ